MADGALRGKAGTIRMFDDGLAWLERSGQRIFLPEGTISKANLSALPIVGATQMILSMRTGEEVPITITAPIDTVMHAMTGR
jgi:hypothetical protein